MKRGMIPVLILLILLLGGCSRQRNEIHSFADMKNLSLTVGAPDDIDISGYFLDICPNAKILPQNDELYGMRSLSEGKLDAYVAGRDYLDKAINEANVKGVRILDEPLISYQCALGISELCQVPGFEQKVNEALERMISDGTIKEMRRRWFEQGNEQMPAIKLDEHPEYTLNAVTFGQSKPYSYFKDGALSGFDVELIYRVCQQNHWGITLTSSAYTGMLMGLSTGKYDIISADLYVTENRKENIVYSVPYRVEEICVAVRGLSESASEADGDPKLEYNTLSDLQNAKQFAIMTGTVFDAAIKEQYPQAEIKYYPTPVDCALAVANRKADAAVFDAPMMKYIAACTDGVGLIPEYLAKEDYHFILPKSERGEQLRKEFNQWLDEQERSGELAVLYDFWCSDEEPDTIFDFAALPANNGTVRIITDAAGRPDAYYFNNRPTGFSIELLYRFCRDRGYSAELSVVTFDSALPSIASEKADMMAAFLSYTEERAQNVLFTDPVLEGGVGILVRKVSDEGRNSLLDVLKDGFRKTFLVEQRWKLIASGLGMTALITLGGFLLANLLGAVFCACAMSKVKGLRIVADVYDRIMQGTPMVVILLILYYVIFGKSDISGSWVAVIAFGMTSGASLARQFCGAINGVDKGQTEAALAIGLTKRKAFLGIVFPQAARTALPGYFSEIIALMKGTAIVGYISVIDLTKASDLIRSSTYDAFFPLLSVALIYFLITFGILSLLKYIQKKLAPKRLTAQEAKK